MRYYSVITDGVYVCGLAESESPFASSITAEEKDAIFNLLCHKPTDTDGYTYKLRADTLEWELVKLPESEPQNEELTDSEALDIILGGGSNET